jgi:hypothetical protein
MAPDGQKINAMNRSHDKAQEKQLSFLLIPRSRDKRTPADIYHSASKDLIQFRNKEIEASSCPLISVLIKIWELGSSTSQSRIWAFGKELARLVAVVVLPVPPLPLATEMIMAASLSSGRPRSFPEKQSDVSELTTLVKKNNG